MRIGIDARMFRTSTAGIGRYSQNLIKNLLNIDHDNQYILFMTAADAVEIRNAHCRGQGMQCEMRNCQIRIVNIPHYSIAEQLELPGIINQEKLDLMLFLNFNYPVFYRGKFISVIHDLTLFFYPETARETNFIKRLAFKFVIKKACENSIHVIAVSSHTKNDIINHFHIAKEKIFVIPEAADERTLNFSDSIQRQIKEKYKILGPLILYVGQFRPHKNIPGLLKAFAVLKKDIKEAKLAILGKPDPAYQDFWATLGILGIKKDILMPGFVKDEELASWYAIADVFVAPSFYEGFGLPGLEAMKAGLPVVSSNRTSLPEVYKDAALYFDPSNIGEIADKIKMVLEDKKRRGELIKKGKIVASSYSWQKTAEETIKIYKQVINK